MSSNLIRKAELVRIELVMDGATYELELTNPDDADLSVSGLTATLDLDLDTMRRPDPSGLWWQELPTGGATVRLTAHGRLTKSERRTA